LKGSRPDCLAGPKSRHINSIACLEAGKELRSGARHFARHNPEGNFRRPLMLLRCLSKALAEHAPRLPFATPDALGSSLLESMGHSAANASGSTDADCRMALGEGGPETAPARIAHASLGSRSDGRRRSEPSPRVSASCATLRGPIQTPQACSGTVAMPATRRR